MLIYSNFTSVICYNKDSVLKKERRSCKNSWNLKCLKEYESYHKVSKWSVFTTIKCFQVSTFTFSVWIECIFVFVLHVSGTHMKKNGRKMSSMAELFKYNNCAHCHARQVSHQNVPVHGNMANILMRHWAQLFPYVCCRLKWTGILKSLQMLSVLKKCTLN